MHLTVHWLFLYVQSNDNWSYLWCYLLGVWGSDHTDSKLPKVLKELVSDVGNKFLQVRLQGIRLAKDCRQWAWRSSCNNIWQTFWSLMSVSLLYLICPSGTVFGCTWLLHDYLSWCIGGSCKWQQACPTSFFGWTDPLSLLLLIAFVSLVVSVSCLCGIQDVTQIQVIKRESFLCWTLT